MEFVHYNTAKLAKEKGYNGTSGVYYDTTGSLYTQTYSEGIGTFPILAAMLLYRKNLVSG